MKNIWLGVLTLLILAIIGETSVYWWKPPYNILYCHPFEVRMDFDNAPLPPSIIDSYKVWILDNFRDDHEIIQVITTLNLA